MDIQKAPSDKQKAKNLLNRAEEFLRSLPKKGEVSFLLNAEYDILHALAGALSALDGEKIRGKDHHKILVAKIIEKYSNKISIGEANIWEELRKIRNDINYYGQKDKATLQDFYERNKEKIIFLREKLFIIIREKFKQN